MWQNSPPPQESASPPARSIASHKGSADRIKSSAAAASTSRAARTAATISRREPAGRSASESRSTVRRYACPAASRAAGRALMIPDQWHPARPMEGLSTVPSGHLRYLPSTLTLSRSSSAPFGPQPFKPVGVLLAFNDLARGTASSPCRSAVASRGLTWRLCSITQRSVSRAALPTGSSFRRADVRARCSRKIPQEPDQLLALRAHGNSVARAVRSRQASCRPRRVRVRVALVRHLQNRGIGRQHGAAEFAARALRLR
jgi:hypothetical protein